MTTEVTIIIEIEVPAQPPRTPSVLRVCARILAGAVFGLLLSFFWILLLVVG